MAEIDPRGLRHAFGSFMTGVTVVTTKDKDENPVGFTANSFASVSLDPPLVLVCLANGSRNYDTFKDAAGFAVNVLSEGQKDVSNTFASPVEDRFGTVQWEYGPQGSPVVEDVSAWFDCAIHNRVEAGDHLILIGEVKAYKNSGQPGLGYARGAYVTPVAEAEALSNTANLVVCALIECEGTVLLQADEAGTLALPEATVRTEGAVNCAKRLIAEAGATAEPGYIYSVYEDEARQTQHIAFLCKASDRAATQGRFTELSTSTLTGIADPALRTMLERFAQESRIGNLGVYYGNQVSGDVRPLGIGS